MPIRVREAVEGDRHYITQLMVVALQQFYGGDHQAHAKRILDTHLAGGVDNIGHFSSEQRMFLAVIGDEPAGMVHLVGKRQGTYKISPLIVDPTYRGKAGVGSLLLRHATTYAEQKGARQLYCTVAGQNLAALQFFLANGFLIAGKADSQYKSDQLEYMLYRPLEHPAEVAAVERTHITVQPFEQQYSDATRSLILQSDLACDFDGVDSQWVDALFAGHERRASGDVNQKYKIIHIAVDRDKNVLGVAGATPKKGEPIKLMPLIASTDSAFEALVVELPYALRKYGHKLYTHLVPNVRQTVTLQRAGWGLDAAMPAAYSSERVTQQWSRNLESDVMRVLRVKSEYFADIMMGRKKLEVRVQYPHLATLLAGERIRLVTHNTSGVIRVNALRRYSSFDEALEQEQAELIAPRRAHDVATLLREIYPPEKEALGILVLEVEHLQTDLR